MGIKTGTITFNVRERGRRFRGQDRNFDTAAMAALLNGNEVQEQVKNGDMLGYYGHWPRVKFGLDLKEAGLAGGKTVNLEPALRTTSIKGYPDGTIEHEVEFLDTAPGRLAQRVWQSKAGGFSSAIHAPRRGSMQVPTAFHGFDFVLEPNYTGNRGYVLDSAGNRVDLDTLTEHEQQVLDDVGEYNQLMATTETILDRVQGEFDRQAETVTVLHEENVALQGEALRLSQALDAANARNAELAKALTEHLDSASATAPPPADGQVHPAQVLPPERVRLTRDQVLDTVSVVAKPESQTRFAHADAFLDKATKLAEYEKPEGEKREETAADRYISRAFGVG